MSDIRDELDREYLDKMEKASIPKGDASLNMYFENIKYVNKHIQNRDRVLYCYRCRNDKFHYLKRLGKMKIQAQCTKCKTKQAFVKESTKHYFIEVKV